MPFSPKHLLKQTLPLIKQGRRYIYERKSLSFIAEVTEVFQSKPVALITYYIS